MSFPPADLLDPQPHSKAEDVYALATGTMLVALGLVFLRSGGLVTGGVAGIALLVSYLLPIPLGLLFTLLNLPFFWFARHAMGARFIMRTIIVNVAVAVLSGMAQHGVVIAWVHPLAGAVIGGTLVGLGALVLARHHAGIGGTGVLTLWLQKRRGWNAGRSQLAIDATILAVSLIFIAPGRVAWSAISIAAISGILIAFHRPGRYTGY